MPAISVIDDIDDPRLEPYRDIRERDLVGRSGLFVAEGRVVLEKVVASPRLRLHSLLIAAHRLESMASVIDRLDDETPVFVASQPVIDSVAGFPLHRGLLGIGRRIDPPTARDLLAGLPARGIVLVLVGIANHDNMGGLFRNAAAFGVHAVLLDPSCCDPLYRKSIRVSVGAALLVPFARIGSIDEALSLLDTQDVRSVALSPRGLLTLAELPAAARTALWLGAEGPGLPAGILDRATSIRIPMAGDFDSLNVATTSGIVLHHLVSAPSANPRPGGPGQGRSAVR